MAWQRFQVTGIPLRTTSGWPSAADLLLQYCAFDEKQNSTTATFYRASTLATTFTTVTMRPSPLASTSACRPAGCFNKFRDSTRHDRQKTFRFDSFWACKQSVSCFLCNCKQYYPRISPQVGLRRFAIKSQSMKNREIRSRLLGLCFQVMNQG